MSFDVAVLKGDFEIFPTKLKRPLFDLDETGFGISVLLFVVRNLCLESENTRNFG